MAPDKQGPADFGKLVGQMWADFVPGGLFLATEMLPKRRPNPETVTPGPHQWPRGGRDGIFVNFWIILGIALWTRGIIF